MAKKLFLSNSQINTYTECPRKWHLDKVQRLRPNWKANALFFGSALDSAIECILLKHDKDPADVFLDAMTSFDINGKNKTLPEDILSARFGTKDAQDGVLTEADFAAIGLYCETELDIEPVEVSEFLEYCKQQRKSKTALETNEQKIYNFIAWTGLKRKGLMLLPEVQEWIKLNVVEVHSVQKKISIANENGDQFIGYLDFVVTLKDGRKVLIDFKTSADENKYYPADSAEKSRQLGIYSQEEQIPEVAYLVASKNIRKREPRVRLKFVEGIITEEHLDEVFEEIEEVTTEIKENLPKGEKAFPKNEDSCMNFSGCQYRGYCRNKNMAGLEYVKK